VKTAAQAAANWAASSGRAATAWADGVNAYSGDWAGATTRQQSVMVNNWSQAVSSGQWARGVNAVGTGGWKSATVASQGNFSNGFQKGAQNQATAIQKIMQAEANIVGSLPPRGDFNANVQRALNVIQGLHALKGTLGAKA
jgi:hypothetical protein